MIVNLIDFLEDSLPAILCVLGFISLSTGIVIGIDAYFGG